MDWVMLPEVGLLEPVLRLGCISNQTILRELTSQDNARLQLFLSLIS